MTYSQPSGHAKTGPLRHTDHYVFNSADCIGKGATASVYLGRHKDTGDVVAIKVFNAYGCRQIGSARNRELELLPSISHKNVMRFIACEKEVENRQDVLVMEYCSAGSLYTVLEQPQNCHGLQEREFLKFLTDLSSGLQYLRSRGILHRDIKPGNIMKRVEEDGNITYVLTDFGASRELDDDETFMSLHGTEEYLHPGMYQQAVLRHPGQQQFTSSVDLWSIGVTVYHVATGRLPFQAYGGRANTQTMFQITSSRRSGVISGVQQQSNGPIIWSRKLPATCHLSECLRRILEPILAGLFESDPQKALTFDKYFQLVSNLADMKTMQVFNAQRGTNIKLYLKPTDNLTDLQEKLASLTDVPAHSQLILLSHRELATAVESRDEIRNYPKAICSTQLYMFEKENYEIHKLLPPEIPPFPSVPVEATIGQDAVTARKCAAVAHYIQIQTEVILEAQTLLRAASSCLRQFIKDRLKPLDACVPKLDTILDLTRKRHTCLLMSQNNLLTLAKLMEKIDPKTFISFKERLDFCSTENGLNTILEKATTRTEEIKLYQSVLEQRMKEQEVSYCTEGLGCGEDDHCLSKMKQVCQDILGVLTTFARHKKYGDLHTHEQFIHNVERQRLSDLCVKILSLYQSHCLHGLSQVHQTEQRQSSMLLRHLTRTGKVESNVSCVTDCQLQINEKLDKLDNLYRAASLTLTSRVHEIITTGHVTVKNGKGQGHLNGETVGGAAERKDITESSINKRKASSLIDEIVTEMNSLQVETNALDRIMKSNTDSLLDLKRMLQETSSLNTDSFQQEEQS